MTQENTTPETATTEANAVHHQTKKGADLALAKKAISPDSHRAIHEGRISLEEARELGREGSPFGPAPKTADKNDRTRSCMCGCNRETRGRFAAGHDARVKGWIVKAVREGTLDELSEEIQGYAAERDLIRQTRERMAEEDRRRAEKETNKKPKK
ncbi:MAG: hypothetical protein M3R38_20225 [Actinomycetota bacterium]|nr:hypothetical protein [Actinomycetota bacterium]